MLIKSAGKIDILFLGGTSADDIAGAFVSM